MCIIAISPSGTDKLSPFFERALKKSATVNQDGMGFAFKKHSNQTIYYNKGFSSVSVLLNAISDMKIKQEDELIVHFRIRTQGVVSAENCHPFVLSPDIKAIDSPGASTTLSPVMFHNGNFSEFSSSNSHSDTYNFVLDFMRIKDIYNMAKQDKIKFMQIFDYILGHNKLAFLFPKTMQPLTTIGNFVEDEGYYFSNQSYKSVDFTPMEVIRNLPIGVNLREVINKRKNNIKEFVTKRQLEMTSTSFKDDDTVGKITFNSDIAQELVYIAKRDLLGIDIKKGDKFILDQWVEGERFQKFINISTNSFSNFVSKQDIDDDFTLMPKMGYIDKYHSYFKLCNVINPTKSQIKKLGRIYNNYKTSKKNHLEDTNVTIKYNNKYLDGIRLDSLGLFLLDHEHFIQYSDYLD